MRVPNFEVKATKLATSLHEDNGPKGFSAWAKSKGVESRFENEYDCAILAFCTDIYDRGWATYLRFGMSSSHDLVRDQVVSRTLEPLEQRIVELVG